MSERKRLSNKHNLFRETSFHFKAAALTAKRHLTNVAAGTKSFRRSNALVQQPVISESTSDLWNVEDNDYNRLLTFGKVQNLRVAARKLDGVEVVANATFSFWQHVGMPTERKGFVLGREIREGCIVPTIAGGLCQLSNALYDAALKAGFEIVERHRHTKVIKGSLAEADRDATVKWNYIDLRFRSQTPFRIEIEFTDDELVVRFKGSSRHDPNVTEIQKPVSKLNDCYSCGNATCFKHPQKVKAIPAVNRTAFLLDEHWKEHSDYINRVRSPHDVAIVPFAKDFPLRIKRFEWKDIGSTISSTRLSLQVLTYSGWVRIQAKLKANLPSLLLHRDESVLMAMKPLVPLDCAHLVVSQNLLPFAQREGLLWGRTYDVLMTRLPMETLQQRLDAAFAVHPKSKTLDDFRAAPWLVDLENTALTKSRNVITPHRDIASVFNNKSVLVDWQMPSCSTPTKTGSKVLFPASALARKGAFEMKRLAEELGFGLVVTGNALEHKDFWHGIAVEKRGTDLFNRVGLVVYPAFVEHQPRILLKALSRGIDVVATTACGLAPHERLTIVPAGDYEALKVAVQKKLTTLKPTESFARSVSVST